MRRWAWCGVVWQALWNGKERGGGSRVKNIREVHNVASNRSSEREQVWGTVRGEGAGAVGGSNRQAGGHQR